MSPLVHLFACWWTFDLLSAFSSYKNVSRSNFLSKTFKEYNLIWQMYIPRKPLFWSEYRACLSLSKLPPDLHSPLFHVYSYLLLWFLSLLMSLHFLAFHVTRLMNCILYLPSCLYFYHHNSFKVANSRHSLVFSFTLLLDSVLPTTQATVYQFDGHLRCFPFGVVVKHVGEMYNSV